MISANPPGDGLHLVDIAEDMGCTVESIDDMDTMDTDRASASFVVVNFILYR